MNTRSRLLLLVLVATFSEPTAHAASYYVSSSAGDDGNAGTSARAPWRTIARINEVSLAAGDRVYLKAGDKFLDSGMVFSTKDTGTATNPIIVDVYGGSARAVIMPRPEQHGINVYNVGGITVRNLHLIGHGPGQPSARPSFGVSLWCDLKNGARLSGVRFENLLVSWFYKGIVVGADDSSFSGFADVVIADTKVKSCVADGIVTYGSLPGSREKQSHRNLQVLRCTVSQCAGDPKLKGPHSGSGIIMSGTVGGLIDQCVAHDNGGGAIVQTSGGGPVGIWCWGCDAVTIQNCLVYNQRSTPGVQDGGGFDIDGGATSCVVQNCYSYNNDGYGFLVCEFKGAAPLVGAIVRHNISWKDGRERNQSGLGLWNGNPSWETCRRVVFHHNTVICDASAGSVVKLGFESSPLEAEFYNNLLVRTGGNTLVDVDRHVAGLVFKGNLYWVASGSPEWRWEAGSFTSLEAWRAAAGSPETHEGKPVGLVANPRLADLPNGFAASTIAQLATMTAYRPAHDSPAVSGGIDLSAVTAGRVSPAGIDFGGSSLRPGQHGIGACKP